MHLWTLIGFIAVAVAAVATPGPDVILAMANGYRFGLRRALPGFVAVLCSDLLMILAVAAGLGAMLIASAFWFAVLKYVGAFYLLYLGIRMMVTGGSLPDSLKPTSTGESSAARRIVWRSFVVAVSNPKSYLFFAALLPQFVDPSLPVWPQYVALACTFVVVELAIMFAYALAGQRLGSALSLKWAMRFERGCGSAMIAAGAGLLLVKRGAGNAQ